jgi:glucokinase
MAQPPCAHRRRPFAPLEGAAAQSDVNPPAHLPHPCLVADIGGTNARFALATTPDAPLSPIIRLPTGGHADFAETAREAIAKGGFSTPRTLLIAAAGPVDGQAVTLTNARTHSGQLTLDGPRLAERLGLDQGMLLNDFEALSLALPFLAADDLLPIGGGRRDAAGTLLVVGPGTGLGVGALMQADGRFLPVASEGGHAGMGPETAEDNELWPHLGKERVSAENLISGGGLLRLYTAIAAMRGAPSLLDSPAAVTTAAVSGADPIAAEAAGTLLRLLGRFAGDMALALGATGGVFIGGGVAPRLQALLPGSGLREAFEAKGPESAWIKAVSTELVRSDAAALIGLAALASTPPRFMLDFGRRLWRAV